MAQAAHPGDDWPHFCPMRRDKPPLPVEGRRSIYAAWPPAAVCEKCGFKPASKEGGYVGPVDGDLVRFPNPTTRFVCEPCARSSLGLTDTDLSGHSCQPRCSDLRHVELIPEHRNVVDVLSQPERIARYANDYAERGWRVVDVREAPWSPKVMGKYWAVWLEPIHQLPWVSAS
jgi:hypothetical protein